jgi:tRNA dimethylallyltransferase
MKPVIVVAGPTASGKSALALRLAETFGGAIVNADSMQVYRELRVLSARPGPEDEARAPHRLYGVLSARETCSAGRWRRMALEAVAEADRMGRVPILVGGTGLYLRALMAGLAEIPEIPEAVRREVRAHHAAIGQERFRAELEARDPDTAARLDPREPQRHIRAMEVLRATGKPISTWLSETQAGEGWTRPTFVQLVMPAREALIASCDARFDAMMRGGALEEAKTVAAMALDPVLPATRALGLRELLSHLAGDMPLDEAVATAKAATRRYAKRQATWFRHQIQATNIVAPQHLDRQFLESFAAENLPIIRSFLLTHRA